MSQLEPGHPLNEWAALYAAWRNPRVRLRVGSASVGWGLLGASAVAARSFLPALRSQPPAVGGGQVASAWAGAIFSHNERLAAHFADANQIPTVAVNLTDLLDRHDIQCVYVSSHPRHHYPLTMAALAAGKHVLCEPPLALTVEEAQTLVQAAADRGRVLGVNFVARANPAVQVMHTWLRNDRLGDLLGGRVSNTALLPTQQQTWRLQPGGGGVVIDRTIHDLDVVRFLLGDEIASLYGAAGPATLSQSARMQVPEEVVGHVQLAHRPLLVQIHDGWSLAHRPTLLELNGTYQSTTIEHWTGHGPQPTLTATRLHHRSELPLPVVDPFWVSILRFQQAVAGAGRPLATGEDGLQSVILADALLRSLREKIPVQVPRVGF
jgi:1,5-anhydro-D-fructose reductase (1,5-anhydro-D-mannitol-forming)